MTQWTITKDLLANPKANPGTNENAVGLVGPDRATLTHDEIVKHPEAKQFRMYDDDDVLYYEGALVGWDEFAPLDDFGGPNAGCTRIDYFEHGEWRPL